MKTPQLFLSISGLMVLAFILYVAAPSVRARLSPAVPTPTANTVIIPPSQQFPQESKPIVAQKPHAIQAATVTPHPTSPEQSPYQYPPATEPQENAQPQGSVPADFESLWHQTNGVRVVTFPIYAGQELRITNPEFNFVKIETDFPAAVKIGNCQATETTHISCNNVSINDPILVQDNRLGLPPNSTPRNRIRVVAIKH
jgi:hypothetical protein